MATSGSTNFSVTRDQLISGALRLCGVIAEGETATTEQINNGAEALNMLVKRLYADGMPLWAMKQYSVPLTSGTSAYKDRKSTRLNSSHMSESRMPSSA